jgi:type I restriction enzyme R subunit
MHDIPSFKEDHISQIPALLLLMQLGFTYLNPKEAQAERGGRLASVLLDGILEKQLRKINKIHYKGEELPFSEGNIQTALQALKAMPYDGLVRTNEKIYDLLTLGKSLQQTIYGDVKSFTLHYIAWQNIGQNVFHVSDEFAVERSGSHDTRRPDIVLFVNGIPLVVIECKRPDIKEPIAEAVSQQIRNQKEDNIPKLFLYSQILLALSKNEAAYATTGTSRKFWATWQEASGEQELQKLLGRAIPQEAKDKLFSGRYRYARADFAAIAPAGRAITEQDRAIYALCRPARLLEIFSRYILYDAGEKKIARYHQYACIQNIIERIQSVDQERKRKGGVVWHTQGSGKSLTMVMLAKKIALDAQLGNYKIILVTDRVDLDEQIYDTFDACGTQLAQATTGQHLLELLQQAKARIIATTIFKFQTAINKKVPAILDNNIFVLVDESHRTNYGKTHAKMCQILPQACYIGFTGTPLLRKDKNTVAKFGGLIEPSYTIIKAVSDRVVVPLLYEGRHVPQDVQAEMLDNWFERITEKLSAEQKSSLKRKFACARQLNRAEQKVMAVAWDIASHFYENWQGTPFKAQLVADRKLTALRYKYYLDEFAKVTSEVLISGPDEREGEDDIYEESKEPVIRFWKKTMEKYGTEKAYNRQVISAFKNGEDLEIIIVVDKLLTGFDAPRNTILYLTRKLEGHSLLQAVARVNRLYEGKEFGYVLDYYGILSKLGKALDRYGSLAGFDKNDLDGTLNDVGEYIQNLAQQYADLWDIFKTIGNKLDAEAFERLLGDEERRDQFYQKFSQYSRTLAVALSSAKFLAETPAEKIEKYKQDMKFFMNLRTAVRKRYAEEISFREYEPKIQKLIDTHVGAGQVEQITPLVNIFDQENFAKELAKVQPTASRADTIAHRTARVISEKMSEDPVYYGKFSLLLKQIIEDFRKLRITDAEYLRKAKQIMNSVIQRTGDELPDSLQHADVARAFYGIIYQVFGSYQGWQEEVKEIASQASLNTEKIIQSLCIVNWENNVDIQNRMRNAIEDYLFTMQKLHNIRITFDDMDKIMEGCLEIARLRCHA